MSDEATHPSPHDALFKRVFADVARGGALLRALLPSELAAAVEWSTLELRPGESVGADLRGLASDLVFSARADGHAVHFHVLVEHQSTADPRMPFRIAEYVVRLWQGQSQPVDGRLELPLIVPIVVYHGARPWKAPLDVGEAIMMSEALASSAGSLVPRLRYLLDDLTQLDADGLRARGLPAFATLALWALRSAFDRGFISTAANLSGLFDEVVTADDGGQALASLFGYLFIISRPDEDLVSEVLGHVSPRVREEVMELEEMLAAKKLEQGRAEGRAEGRAQRGAELVMKLLRLKFGAIDAGTEERVRAGSDADLDRWAERVLTASQLQDVFA